MLTVIVAATALNLHAAPSRQVPLPHLARAVAVPVARTTAAVAVAAVPGESEIDRLGQFRVKPTEVFLGSTFIVVAATALQVVTPGWMIGTLGASSCEAGLGAALLGFVEFLQTQKVVNPLGLVLAHGIVTKACADVLAQTIPQQDSDEVWIDALRAFRSMLASVLSTSLPFYWWTRFMAHAMPVAPFWVTAALGCGFGTAFFKTVVTQATFRPLNVFLFLFLQSVFRGDSARQLVSMIRAKIRGSVIGGVAFYSVSNLIMYSVPVPFLHPIMGSVAGLIFNVWLAIVAYRK